MANLRVAILGWHPLYDNRIIGGPEAVIVHLAQGLRRQGDVEVHVVVCNGEVREDTAIQRDGVTIHAVRLRPVPRWTLLRTNARAVRRVVQAIAPDVVHAHGSGIFADAALSSGLPALITLHGIIWREAEVARRQGLSWRQRLSWAYDQWYERWCLRRAQDVVAISPYVKQAYRHLTRARLHLIENPVGDAYFDLPGLAERGAKGQQAQQKVPGQPAEPVILCAARVIPRKNILTLLQAFARLHRRMPQARLRIAGEMSSYPDYAARCRQFVREQRLESAVAFLGWLDEPAIQEEYRRCTCLALVSWQETAPIAIEQAMAAGRPVVASDVGGVRYMLADGRAGLLVAPDDEAGIVEALQQVLTDDALRQRLGQRGRQEALHRFRSDAVAAKTRALYERVIREQS